MHYVLEKLSNTLEVLAVHPGDARARLASAYLLFHTRNASDFPQELQAQWVWVMAEMVKFGPVISPSNGDIWVGAVEHTMRRIRNATAVKIAAKIYELHWAVSSNQRYR